MTQSGDRLVPIVCAPGGARCSGVTMGSWLVLSPWEG